MKRLIKWFLRPSQKPIIEHDNLYQKIVQLEDRIVKLFFSERCGRGETGSRRLPGEEAPPRPSFQSLGRQPIVPSVSEIHANPRARSAKLRFAIRTEAPSLPISNRLEQITRLPMQDRGKN